MAIITSGSCAFVDADWSPNMMSKLSDTLFAVWNAELTSIPFAFHAKNPMTNPEKNISMFPKLL